MYFLIFTFFILVVPLFLTWLYLHKTKNARLRISRMVNIKTGARLPGLSLMESLYNLFVRKVLLGPGEIALYEVNKYGGIHQNFFFGFASITIGDPALVKYVLKRIDDFPKAPRVESLKEITRIFGTRSIITINQPEWHDIRSILNKAFVTNKIFFQPMLKKVLQCVSLWSKGEQVKVAIDIQKMTLDVLGICIFGQDFDILNGNQSGPLAAYNYSMKCMNNPMRFMFPWFYSLPLPSNFKLDQKLNEFNNYCWSIIENAKKNIPSQTEDDSKCTSLIQLMIDGNMKDQDIRDNVSLFFLAGHETTSSTLSWAVGLLASYPEIQNKARMEVLEKTQNGLTFESIKDLNYIDWFIHETLRMYPAAPVFGQRVVKADSIIGDWKIPEKTVIQIDVISMLYDPNIWGDPRTFRPERWSPENLTKEQRSVWLPFSYGPRVCIGMNFSLLEQKIFLASLLKEFSCIQLSKNASLEVDGKGLLNIPHHDKLKVNFVK